MMLIRVLLAGLLVAGVAVGGCSSPTDDWRGCRDEYDALPGVVAGGFNTTINLSRYGSCTDACRVFTVRVAAVFDEPHRLIGMWGFALKETRHDEDMYALEASSYFDRAGEVRPAAFYEINDSGRRYLYANRTVRFGEWHDYALVFREDDHPRLLVDGEEVLVDRDLRGVPQSGDYEDFRYCGAASGVNRGWVMRCANLTLECNRTEELS